MKVKSVLLVISLVALSGISIYNLLEIKKQPQIAYVRTKNVLEKYVGMQEAQELYHMKMEKWNSDFDSISNSIHTEETKTESAIPNETKAGIVDRYQRSIQRKAEEENLRLTQGVLNKVNQFIESYAKEHSLEVIFGVTESGSILYGGNNMDITEEIIDGLNKQYLGK